MDKLKEALSKKIGPLPAGAWLLAIAGGIAVAVFVRRGAQDQEAISEAYAEGEQAAADSIVGGGFTQGGNTDTAGGVGGGDYMDWYDGEEPVEPEPFPLPEPELDSEIPDQPESDERDAGYYIRLARSAGSNGGWQYNITQALVMQGYQPWRISTAFRKFFKREDLSGAEQAVVSAAIAKAGPPPNYSAGGGDSGADRPRERDTQRAGGSGGGDRNLSRIERLLRKYNGDKSKTVAALTGVRDNRGGARKLSRAQLREIGFSERFIREVKG